MITVFSVDTLSAKFPLLSEKLAVRVFVPEVVNVRAQEATPLTSEAWQDVAPSPMVTRPAGLPLPGAIAATATLIVIGWPAVYSPERSVVIVVVVLALATV